MNNARTSDSRNMNTSTERIVADVGNNDVGNSVGNIISTNEDITANDGVNEQQPLAAGESSQAILINFGVDNKKIPLNRYKGIFQRIMRKSRAIKNYRSIANHEKKKTTQSISFPIHNDELEEENDEPSEVSENLPTEIADEITYENDIVGPADAYDEDAIGPADVGPVNSDRDSDEDAELDDGKMDDIDMDDGDDEEEEEEVSSIEEDDSDEFKDSDSSKEIGRADLDELGERYN
jgi:hypothetical protein